MVKYKIYDYIVYLIWVFFLFVTIYDLFIIPARSIFWALQLLLSIFIYNKFDIPIFVYFGLLLIFLANIFGEHFLGLFYVFPYYDKIIHLLSPLLACTFFYFIFDKRFKDKKLLIIFSVTLLLSFELFFELVEYFFDKNFNTILQGVHQSGVKKFGGYEVVLSRFDDTIYDMFLNLVGSIIFAIISFFILTKKNMRRVRNFF
ncbi:MAG: hypothetical protein QXD05_02340 [Candidatus Pacearchaeota archaeon]